MHWTFRQLHHQLLSMNVKKLLTGQKMQTKREQRITITFPPRLQNSLDPNFVNLYLIQDNSFKYFKKNKHLGAGRGLRGVLGFQEHFSARLQSLLQRGSSPLRALHVEKQDPPGFSFESHNTQLLWNNRPFFRPTPVFDFRLLGSCRATVGPRVQDFIRVGFTFNPLPSLLVVVSGKLQQRGLVFLPNKNIGGLFLLRNQ